MASDHQKRTSLIGTALAGTVAIVLLYVLSVGPAVTLRERGRISKTTFDKLYFPLRFRNHRSYPIHAVLEWYAGKWALSHPEP